MVRVLNLMHVGNFYCQTEAVIFGADMRLSTHFDNEKKKKKKLTEITYKITY